MSADVICWFSAADLATLGKAGVIDIPGSERWAGDRALKLEWLSRKVQGKGGKGGKRTEYQPHADVLAQIHAFLEKNPDFFSKDKKLTVTFPAGHGKTNSFSKVVPRMEEPVPRPYSVSPGTGDKFDQVALWAEPAIRLTLIVRRKPLFAKAPDDLLQRVSLLALRFVFLFCDGDLTRINQWLNDSTKTDGLVRMAYEGDCMKRGVAPGSDLDNQSEFKTVPF